MGFFFQAEDGIRDSSVTGVQTCALPILNACLINRESGTALNRIIRGCTTFMSENHRSDSWLPFGLSFVGGYGDAAGYALAKTSTPPITGPLILSTFSIDQHHYRTFLRHL